MLRRSQDRGLASFVSRSPLAIVLFGMSLLACAHARPQPIPAGERIPLSVVTRDVTKLQADSAFTEALSARLSKAYLYLIEPTKRSSAFAGKLSATAIPNPFRPARPNEAGALVVPGDLERLDYAPALSSDDSGAELVGFLFFGVIGAAMAHQSSDSDLFDVAMQLRFRVPVRGEELPLLVRVARRGDVRVISRTDQTKLAAQDASQVFLRRLAELLEAQGLCKKGKMEMLNGTDEADILARFRARLGPAFD